MKELTTFWGNTNPAEGKTCTLQYLSERSSRKDMSMAATAILPATVRNMQSRQLYGKSIWIYIYMLYMCVILRLCILAVQWSKNMVTRLSF